MQKRATINATQTCIYENEAQTQRSISVASSPQRIAFSITSNCSNVLKAVLPSPQSFRQFFPLDIPEEGNLETSIMNDLILRYRSISRRIDLIIISCENCDCEIQRTRQQTTAIWHGIRERGEVWRGEKKRRSVEVFCGVREPLWSGLLRQSLGFTPFDRHT